VSKPKVTQREVRLARSFLRAIGGSQTNTYLLLAVIAWQRAMGKAHDAFWKSLARYSASAAGIRLAAKLKSRVAADKHHYVGVLQALRRASKGDSALARQAVDFILALDKSKWDKKHYGYTPFVAGHEETYTTYGPHGSSQTNTVWVPDQQENNPLALAWAALTNNPGIPAAWYTDTVTTKKTRTIPPRPSQPRSLMHVLPRVPYIQPYEAQRFYDAKPHYGDNLLIDD
jgi:hypothetical protein